MQVCTVWIRERETKFGYGTLRVVSIDAGMECHVLKCEWLNGRPDSGHLQEAARNARCYMALIAV